jgi:hypothetical protein
MGLARFAGSGRLAMTESNSTMSAAHGYGLSCDGSYAFGTGGSCLQPDSASRPVAMLSPSDALHSLCPCPCPPIQQTWLVMATSHSRSKASRLAAGLPVLVSWASPPPSVTHPCRCCSFNPLTWPSTRSMWNLPLAVSPTQALFVLAPGPLPLSLAPG